MKNLFLSMSDEDLMQHLYCYYSEMRTIGIVKSQPLRGTLDQYCDFYYPQGCLACEVDLLYAVSLRWALSKNM